MTINTAPAAFQAMLYGGAILGVLTALICLVAALWYTIQAKMSSDDKIKSGANSHLKNVAVTIGWIGFGIFMLTDLINLAVNGAGLIMTIINAAIALINWLISLASNGINLNQ
ncbi:hypothetical protein A2X44_00325 [candidate division CPR3 bacterium GWF2_35_18]|nr:MAG: hypothetical protein A2X44_00325 [candidate division CPR3 bacterium GWF2_35_18]OGB65573.1 MAG: hypothetical protein A2250_02190 [candidate division CPR3 bacterium RIFOXYA2_FULL_35_13]